MSTYIQMWTFLHCPLTCSPRGAYSLVVVLNTTDICKIKQRNVAVVLGHCPKGFFKNVGDAANKMEKYTN